MQPRNWMTGSCLCWPPRPRLRFSISVRYGCGQCLASDSTVLQNPRGSQRVASHSTCSTSGQICQKATHARQYLPTNWACFASASIESHGFPGFCTFCTKRLIMDSDTVICLGITCMYSFRSWLMRPRNSTVLLSEHLSTDDTSSPEISSTFWSSLWLSINVMSTGHFFIFFIKLPHAILYVRKSNTK